MLYYCIKLRATYSKCLATEGMSVHVSKVTLVGSAVNFIAHILPYSNGKRQYSVNSLAEAE